MVAARRSGAVALRSVRRLLVVILLSSFVLPPAAPALAAPPAAPPLAAGASSAVMRLPLQEGEPYPPDPTPYLPDRAIADPDALPAPEPAAPPVVGTPEPPLQSLVPAPALPALGSVQAVAAAGQPFTVTVRVAAMSADAPLPAGLAVSVRLPQGVALAPESAALTSALPALVVGEEWSQVLTLVADGSSPLLGLEATVAGENVLPITQLLWLAVAAPQASAPTDDDAAAAGAEAATAAVSGATRAVRATSCAGATTALGS
jgi:hypothetical protein